MLADAADVVHLLDYGDGLGALPGRAKRLSIGERSIRVLGIGSIAFAISIDRAARIGLRSCYRLGLGRDRARDVGHGLATAEAGGEACHHGDGCEEPGKSGLLTHGTLTHDIRRIDWAERRQQ